MVHNGIEYGMMQALAEGFEMLHAKDELELDVHQIASIWQRRQRRALVAAWT